MRCESTMEERAEVKSSRDKKKWPRSVVGRGRRRRARLVTPDLSYDCCREGKERNKTCEDNR